MSSLAEDPSYRRIQAVRTLLERAGSELPESLPEEVSLDVEAAPEPPKRIHLGQIL